MAEKIFISYRRNDDPSYAGRLFDSLEAAFGPDQIILDIDKIEPGVDFVDFLEDQVSQCDVFIAVIGSRWLGTSDTHSNRRIDNPGDFVRLELEWAIAKNKHIIPLLVGDATMPDAEQVPESLKKLTRLHAYRITYERFRSDALGLIKALNRRFGRSIEAADSTTAKSSARRTTLSRRRHQRAVADTEAPSGAASTASIEDRSPAETGPAKLSDPPRRQYRRGSQTAKKTPIEQGPGHRVGSYLELTTKIAELQFLNRDHVLLFRGQGADHPNKNSSSLKPTSFRGGDNSPDRATLVARVETLARAERILVAEYAKAKLLGLERLKRHRILRWSILQHYEICTTPLLDVTHSIQIAASFASQAATDIAFLYVLGVPNIGGSITASAEAGLQIVRMSSVCPPSALRPHIQETYMLGEYPEMAGYERSENYFPHKLDFGRSLVAKFSFEPASFWTDGDFPQVARSILYPSEMSDPLYRLALGVKKQLGE